MLTLPTSDHTVADRTVAADEPVETTAGRPIVPAAWSDPAQRVSSHRTSQGHVVYYRCHCGEPRVMMMRWSRGDAPGSRLSAQWAPTCPTCNAE